MASGKKDPASSSATPGPFIPLYGGVDVPTAGEGNAGLRFEKFVPWADVSFRQLNRSDYAKSAAGTVGRASLLNEFVERQKRVVEVLGGTSAEFQTNTRLAAGLGSSHPLENGMTWHPTLGVPYIPATSLKGLARSWATMWDPADADLLGRLFGSWTVLRDEEDALGDNRAKRWVGAVRFFDAVPLRRVKVEADVMTPHHPQYYQRKGPAADWDSPVIIPFMTVAPQTTFLVSVAPRDDAASPEDIDLVWQWLHDALSWIGIGAKTASGYGRLVRGDVPKAPRVVKPVALPPPRSPIHQEMMLDGYDDANRVDRFKSLVRTKWAVRLQDDAHPDRHEIASLLRDWYLDRDPAQWKKPNQKSADAVNTIKRVLKDNEKEAPHE